MEYVFYFVIFVGFVYVMTGVVQSVFFSATPIGREELPPVVEDEVRQFFPGFKPQSITLQKSRQRYQLQGKQDGQPGQLVFRLTPESELAILEFTRTTPDQRFVKLKSISSSQIPTRIANQLQAYFADDVTHMETSKATGGMIGERNAYRIEVDSAKFHYQFEITDAGELFTLRKREVA